MKRLAFLLAAIGLLGLGPAASGAEVRTDNVASELVSARAAVAPGETVTFVLRQTVRSGWHTYWVNPGDSGEATSVTWTLPQGFVAGALLHPAPRVERLNTIVTYVHDGEVLYPVAISVPMSARPGTEAHIALQARWLVCDEICVPEQGAFNLTLPIRAKGIDDARGAALAARAINALPTSLNAAGFELRVQTSRVDIAFPRTATDDNPLSAAVNSGRIRKASYYPYDRSLIDHAAAQKVSLRDGLVQFEMTPSLSLQPDAARGEGLVTAEIQEGGRWMRRAFMFGKPPGEGPLPALVAARWAGEAPAAASASAPVGPSMAGGLLGAMALALLGGLLLNVMPCVFPVLSLKALSLAGGVEAGAARRHGALFFAGVMMTFLVLAGVLIALKAAGAAIGWGFQLQEPTVVATLALLFFVIGLNLVGAFELGGGLQNAGAGLAGRAGDAGAFFTGALAVVAATPCTAPFMASALGWAATQPPVASLATFGALGAGFAAPLTALAVAPGLRRWLPKPGPWMVRVRQALAFPMFGAAVWLVWVLSVQRGSTGTVAILSLFVAAAFAAWCLGQGRVWRLVGVVALLATAIVVWRPLALQENRAAVAEPADAWSSGRVSELVGAGKPVFVNFTAAWCVTCKANEVGTLSRPAVREAFSRAGVIALKADWTARDSVIAQTLAAHGRAGVPLYLYYPAGAAVPRVLPPVLTESIVLAAIAEETAP